MRSESRPWKATQRVGVAGQDRAQVHHPAVRGHDVGLPVPRVVRSGRRRRRLVHARLASSGAAVVAAQSRGSSGSRPCSGKTARRVSQDRDVDRVRTLGPRLVGRRSTPSVIVGGQRPSGEPGGVRDPAGGQRPLRVDVAVEHRGEQVRPRPRHHAEQPVPAAAEREPLALRLCGRPARAAPGRSRGGRRRTARRSASGSSAWVSAPHWVTSSCGRNDRAAMAPRRGRPAASPRPSCPAAAPR